MLASPPKAHLLFSSCESNGSAAYQEVGKGRFVAVFRCMPDLGDPVAKLKRRIDSGAAGRLTKGTKIHCERCGDQIGEWVLHHEPIIGIIEKSH